MKILERMNIMLSNGRVVEDVLKLGYDKNGNRRYGLHYTYVSFDKDEAHKLIKERIGAKKCRAKGYEDYFVFQSCNIIDSIEKAVK